MSDNTSPPEEVQGDGQEEEQVDETPRGVTARRIAGMFDSATVGDPIGDTVVVTGFEDSATGPRLAAEYYVDGEGYVTRRGQAKPKSKLSVL